MEQEDLKKLKQSIKFGDYFALIYFILFIILSIMKIVDMTYILGIVIGYISVKFILERQVKIFARRSVEEGTGMFFNILVYALSMVLMALLSIGSLLAGTFLIITYRMIVFSRFKSLL